MSAAKRNSAVSDIIERIAAKTRGQCKVKKCRRCGCTEDRACAGGCSWVADTDVCSACLTGLEDVFYEDLICRIATGVPNARKQLRLFAQIIVIAPRLKQTEDQP